MMKISKILPLAFIALYFSGCYYDNEEELYSYQNCGEKSNISYIDDIVPIVDRNCYRCHSNSVVLGSVNLEGYTRLKPFVDDGTLLGSIKYESGISGMPKSSPKLNQCDISTIETWINEGANNN